MLLLPLQRLHAKDAQKAAGPQGQFAWQTELPAELVPAHEPVPGLESDVMVPVAVPVVAGAVDAAALVAAALAEVEADDAAVDVAGLAAGAVVAAGQSRT